MSKFAERLKALRISRKIKAEELADVIGSGRRIIFNYEKDEAQPTLDKLVKIADYFDVSLDYLAGRTDEIKK